MEEGIINDEPVWSGRVEWGKVSVPWYASIEIGIWEGSCVKGGSIDESVLCSSPLQRYAVPQVQIVNVLCQFFSSILVDENEGVVLHVVNVELDPVFPRMIWIFFVAVAD